jgi:hypothetical protein
MSRHSDDSAHEAWRRRFERFGKSDLPVAGFCAREGVSVASFYHWRKRLMSNGSGRRPSGRGPAFQPVAVVPATAGVSIYLPCGARIEVGAGDLDTVRAVVAEVARADSGLQREGISC